MKKDISRKQIIIFLLVAFVGGWILQTVASFLAQGGLEKSPVSQLLVIIGMFMPLLGVVVSGIFFKGMGWKPQIRKNLKWIAFSAWVPAVLCFLGALLYFAIFPQHLDTSMETLRLSMGEAVFAQLEAKGFTLQSYVIFTIVQALTFAPFFNILTAIGEEVGWRGALYPYLKQRFGTTKGRILGGILWGTWHWPLMVLAGFEYGKDYFGAPVLGLFVFWIFTTAFGIVTDHVYEKSGTIWMPALIHGAVDAWTIYFYILKPEYADRMILGPSMVGVLSGLPVLALAIFLSVKEAAKEKEILNEHAKKNHQYA